MRQAFPLLLKQPNARKVMCLSRTSVLISERSSTANLIVAVQRMFFALLRSLQICRHTFLVRFMQIVSLISWSQDQREQKCLVATSSKT